MKIPTRKGNYKNKPSKFEKERKKQYKRNKYKRQA